MKNRKLSKLLAAATAAAVLTTSVLPQGMVYASASEPEETGTVISEDDSEMPSEEAVENTEMVTGEPETELSEGEPALQSEDEDEIADVEVEDEVEETGAGEIPGIGDVVLKKTVNVQKGDANEGEEYETNWKLVWSDEFNGTKLDTTKWGYQVGNGSEYGVPGWGNNELEYYTDGDNVSFEDGHLVITAQKDAKYGWTSAKLWTQGVDYSTTGKELYSKKYGRIEAKMSLPKGTGLWPAFWMMPLDDVYGGWASSGEIDIMEARGRLPDSVDGTIHFGNASPNNRNRGGQYEEAKASGENAAKFDFTEEHEYALEWLPGQLKWYVDDECYYTATSWYSTAEGNGANFTYPAPFDQEFFIMLNLAVGGNYDSGRLDESLQKAEMKVDYVRVYDLCDNADGTLHDYTQDEKTVTAMSSSAGGGGLLGDKEIGENYLTGAMKDAQVSVFDEKSTAGDTPNNTGWYLLTGDGAEATVTGMQEAGAENGVAKVDVTKPGSNGHSVQFMHQFPLTEGYSYKLQFDAKADSARTITAQASDYVYTNYDGSWTKYSDMKTVSLTTEWNTYTMEFDMTEISDDHTRLELNLGAGSTGGVYFRNATLVATGLSGSEPEDTEKMPLGNGEHIYNGTFDQGNNKDANDEYTRMKFWKLIGGAQGSVTNDRQRSLTLTSGTSAEAGIEQQKVQLIPREGYKLTFDADGSDVTVNIIGSDGTVYKTEKVSASKGQEVTFEVPSTAKDSYGNIQFIIGNAGGSVTLDNISMIRETNKSADWSNIDFYLLDNWDFSKGQEGWNVFNHGSGEIWGWVNNGTASGQDYNLDIKEDGLHLTAFTPQEGATYSVGIETASMNLTALLNYKFRLKVKDVDFSEMSVKTKKTIGVQMPDGTVEECEIIPGDNDEIVIPFTPKADIEGGTILLHLGQNCTEEYGTYKFVLEYLDFELDTENNEKNEMPEEYKGLKRAPQVKSAGAVELGSDVVLTHDDAEWMAAISEVYVNNKAIASTKIHTTEAGKVTIDTDVFEEAGLYSIRLKANGYDKVTVSQRVGKAHGNLLLDAFRVAYDGKGDGEKGTITTKSYGFGFDVDFVETRLTTYDEGVTYVPMFWTMQARIDDIVTKLGTYVLEFDAELTYNSPLITADRGLYIEYGRTGTNRQEKIAIHPGTDHYKYEMTIGAMEDFYILFMAGGAEANTAPHTLKVSNITFAKANDVLYAAAPKISAQPKGNTYTVGDSAAALTVSAESIDGGSPSYQWYQNSANSTEGATAIAGATTPSYTPNISAAGTTYYYCKVTNTNSAAYEVQTASVDSDIAAVIVNTKTSEDSTTVAVTGVTLNRPTLTVAKGKTATLTATVAPADATNKDVKWSSSDESVATVDANGKVTAIKTGTTDITVTTLDGSKTATCKVTVNIPSTKVKVNAKKIYLIKGKSIKVKATLTPRNSTDKVTWTSANKNNVTVTSGKAITTIKAKTVSSKAVTITAKAASGKKTTLKVYVVDKKKAKKSLSVKLNKKTLTLKKGAITDLTATVKPANSTDTLKWSSSKKSVATVDAYGMVTAKKKGTATITVKTSSGKKATCKVTVK